MEKQHLVLGLLHTVLGRSKPSTKGNHAFNCPFCKHHKPKLEIDPLLGVWHCWVCGEKGRTPVGLLKKLHASSEQISEMRTYFPDGKGERVEKSYETVQLPAEFLTLAGKSNKLAFRQAKAYLTSRGITEEDIVKYNIGYCETGKYRNSVIVPSYNRSGQVNYFISRSFEKDPGRKYNAPSCNKNELIGLEYYINWKCPVILCEGIFDAIALKRNAIPLFGKTIPKALMMKLVESETTDIYLILDKDAMKESYEYAEKFLDIGKKVYLVELTDKDPSDTGFESIIKLLHTVKPVTAVDLLKRKISMV